MRNRHLNASISIAIGQLLVVCILFDANAVARRIEHVPGFNMIRQQVETKKLPRNLVVDALRNGQYFQDIFSEHLAPLKIEFGHVCENPKEWEQRFERKDLGNNHHQGKVRWGNNNGGYGEHYWDLNHGAE